MKVFVLALLATSAAAAPFTLPSAVRGQSKIVGGDPAEVGEFPYQLSFQQYQFGFKFHFCGASIYDASTALCAAHCVYGNDYDNPSNLRIVAGEYNQEKDEGTEQARDVVKIVIHEDYNSRNFLNDISLLKLSSPLDFNDYVAAIPMAAKGQTFTGKATVTGWGTLSSGGATPAILQKVEVPIVSDFACRAAYSASQIADSMMCAGEGGKDSCQGDSGGPLNCGGVQCGVVSWGRSCADPNYPGVYTEVSYFIDWIETNAA